MRLILSILVLLVLAAIVAVWLGVIDLNQTQQAKAPAISAGQAPAYEVKVNPLNVGTTTTNVQVPVVEMQTKQVEVPTITTGSDGNSQ
jgi:Flp pilus assembly protein CpaB